MKNGRFSITLASPTDGKDTTLFSEDLERVCDRFLSWNNSKSGVGYLLNRLRYLFSRYPVAVATDSSREARDCVRKELTESYDVVVFDFVHSEIIAPERIDIPSVLFTHNVEAEIFRRHVDVATNPLMKAVWKSQWRKMLKFESEAVKRFDSLVVVSGRDGASLKEMSGATDIFSIPTGVDLNYFRYSTPGNEAHVVFSGSMDWLANIDGIEYFMDEIWPMINREIPSAKMTVVGRYPPKSLIERAKSRGLPWTFTGFVDDIREHIQGAAVYVIPLRVGGGTRMKAYEAMAMGTPVVSTSIGIEGLPVENGLQYLRADNAVEFSKAVVQLLSDKEFGQRLSKQAREYVEINCSCARAARVFEDVCYQTTVRRAERG
jgi:glycosyltransferase involved in cell wall biosynthesis